MLVTSCPPPIDLECGRPDITTLLATPPSKYLHLSEEKAHTSLGLLLFHILGLIGHT